jgi:hypothetical protein
MYSREEASQLRQSFWTAFGQYMSPVLSSEGQKVNWINYRTGFSGVQFKMDAGSKKADIGITLTHSDTGIQELFFEQFREYQTLLRQYLDEEWNWVLHAHDESGRTVSRIYTEIPGVSVFNRDDWPALIAFFKPRITALDEFWNDVKDGFETLR